MANIFIIHGALRRPSTKKWMVEMQSFFNYHGHTTFCFYWSGIPLRKNIIQASVELYSFFEINKSEENIIIAKSIGADISNISLSDKKNVRSIFICPAFLCSPKIWNLDKTFVIDLSNDKFINAWNILFNFNKVEYKLSNRFIIPCSTEVTHHSMSFNIDVNVGSKEMKLYDLYLNIIENDRIYL